MKKRIFITALLIVGIAVCFYYKTDLETYFMCKNEKSAEYELNEEGIIKPESAKRIIEEACSDVINAIGSKDFETVSGYAHPVKGVRFTPYTTVSEDDVVLNKKQLKDFFNIEDEYTWGAYDGSGDVILLTPGGYYDKFIYTKDFINAEEVGYNEVLSSGNMAENQFEFYENPIVVEYYIKGTNSEFGGIDWESIRIVFEEYEGSWKLVGIIHCQWTI